MYDSFNVSCTASSLTLVLGDIVEVSPFGLPDSTGFFLQFCHKVLSAVAGFWLIFRELLLMFDSEILNIYCFLQDLYSRCLNFVRSAYLGLFLKIGRKLFRLCWSVLLS